MAKLFEYYATGEDGDANIGGLQYRAQTFAPVDAHDCDYVRLKLARYGDPGNWTCGIYPTSGDLPAGSALGEVTLSQDVVPFPADWIDIVFDVPIPLSAGVKYAIVLKAPDGRVGNQIGWTSDGSAATYPRGQACYTNDGTTWYEYPDDDFYFYDYGLYVVDTLPATGIQAKQATGNGFIREQATDIDEIGFEWGTSPGGPYGDDVTFVPPVFETGEYGLIMDTPAMTPETVYYYRAKVHHTVEGWLYGHEETFTTLPPLPTVLTEPPTAKGDTTATLKGNITDLGDTDVTKRGFVYGLSRQSDPGNVAPGSSGYDAFTEESPGPYSTGEYTLGITSLTINKIYYFRAYAYNSDGYDYGGEIPFLTNEKIDFLFPSGSYSEAIRFDTSGRYPKPGSGTIPHYVLVRTTNAEYVPGGWWGSITGDYIYERNYYNDNYYTDLYTLTTPIIRDTAIMKVKYRANLWRSLYPYGKYKRELRTHSTQYTGAIGDISAPTGGAKRVCEIFYTNPNTGNSWTLAELDALIAGVSLGQSGAFGVAICDLVRVVALWVNAEVSNDGSIDIGGDQLRLAGTVVEDEAEECSVYFEWGETVAYGNTTAPQTKAKGESFTADIDLPESGVVHFRAVIETACGETFYSEDAGNVDFPGIWLGDEDDWFKLEITEYVLGARTEIGWDDELAQATAGLGEFTGDNHLGYFSPDNALSPLYGFLYIGARITFREIYKGILYPHFTGRIDRIVPNAEKDNQVAFIMALCGMDDLAGTEISTELFTDTNTGELAVAVLDAAGWPAMRREIDTGIDSLSLGWFHKIWALDAFRRLEAVESGRFWTKPNGNARWENRHARIIGDGLVSQATFDETMVELAYEYSKRLLYNEIKVTGRRYFAGGVQLFSGYDLATLDADLIWSAHSGDAAAPFIPQATTVVIWAEVNQALVSYDTLVKGTHWNANTEADKSGTDVSDNITITERQYGQAVKLTIANAGGVGAYLVVPDSPPVGAPEDRTLLIYGALYSQENITIIEEDTASQKTYGKRTLSVDTPFMANIYDILSYAQHLKERYSTPIPVPVLAKFQARTAWPDDTIYIETLTRHISDRITIVSSLLGIDADFYINKVVQEYVFNEGGFQRETTWSLQAAVGSAEGVFWLLGVAGFGELGETTRLGF